MFLRRKVNVLEMKCLRSLVGVLRMDRARNEEVRRRAPSPDSVERGPLLQRRSVQYPVFRKPSIGLPTQVKCSEIILCSVYSFQQVYMSTPPK